MLKDEFRYDDDLPRENIKRKRGRPKASKNKNNKIIIPIPKKIENKLTKIENENIQLKKCMKEKDKRITHIEDRWIGIKTTLKVITIVGIIISTFLGMFHILTTNFHLFKETMAFFGTITLIYLMTLLITYVLMNNEYPDDNSNLKDSAIITIFVASLTSLFLGIVWFIYVFEGV